MIEPKLTPPKPAPAPTPPAKTSNITNLFLGETTHEHLIKHQFDVSCKKCTGAIKAPAPPRIAPVNLNRSTSLNVSNQPKLNEAPKVVSHDPASSKRSHDSDFESGDEFNHPHDGNSVSKALISVVSPDINNELTLSPPDSSVSSTEHNKINRPNYGAEKNLTKNYIPPMSPNIEETGKQQSKTGGVVAKPVNNESFWTGLIETMEGKVNVKAYAQLDPKNLGQQKFFGLIKKEFLNANFKSLSTGQSQARPNFYEYLEQLKPNHDLLFVRFEAFESDKCKSTSFVMGTETEVNSSYSYKNIHEKLSIFSKSNKYFEFKIPEEQSKQFKTAFMFPLKEKGKEACPYFKEKFGINLVRDKIMLMCVIISPQHLPSIMVQPPPQQAPTIQQAWVIIIIKKKKI